MPRLHQAQFRHAAHFLEVLRRSPYPNPHLEVQGDADPDSAAAEWQQIEHTWRWLAQTHRDEAVARLCSEYPIAGEHWLEFYLPPRERIGWLRTSLVAARSLGLKAFESRHLTMLGMAFAALGDTRAALNSSMDSLAVARETAGVEELATAVLQLATLVSREADQVRTLKLLGRVLDLNVQLKHDRLEALALSRMAEIFLKLKSDDIRELLEKKAEVLDRITGGERQQEEDVFSTGFRTAARIEQEKARYAMELWKTALVLAERSGDPGVIAEIERNIADTIVSKLSPEMIVEDMSADLAFHERIWGKEKNIEAGQATEKEWALLQKLAGREALDKYCADEKSKFDRARTVYETALAFHRRRNDLKRSADVIVRLGHLASSQGHKKRALDLYEEAFRLYERVEDQLGKANALMGIGAIEAILGDEEKARALWRQADEIYEQGADVAGRIDAVGRIVGSYLRSGDDGLMETVELHTRLKGAVNKSATLVELAVKKDSDGDRSGATELLRLAVMVDEETADPQDLAASLCELGLLEFKEHHLERAITLWERALSLSRVVEKDWLTQRLLSNLAQVAARNGNSEHALSRADEIFGLTRDANTYAETLVKIAEVREEAGDASGAVDFYERSLASYESTGDRASQAQMLIRLSEAAAMARDFDRLYQLGNRLLPLLATLKQWDTLVVILCTLARFGTEEAAGFAAQAIWLALRLSIFDDSVAESALELVDKIGVDSPDAPWVAAAGGLIARYLEPNENIIQKAAILDLTLKQCAEMQSKTSGRAAAWYDNGDYLDRETVLEAVGQCVNRMTRGRWLFDPGSVIERDDPI
jgi:tetratricopeptide (TPR) repeat protein